MAPVLKPLAQRGQAKARVLDLGIDINEQQALISSLEADLAVAKQLRELAYHLHDDCQLEILLLQ